MPVPPFREDTFDSVNYIIDSWSMPCEAPWYIYVQTLKPALLEAFIMLLSFGAGDVARGFARPGGLSPRRSGKRKGKKGAFGKPKWPEIGNMLGSKLPGAQAVQGIQYGVLGKTLWRIDVAAQAGLFIWLIASITEDFAVNWTSLLYQTTWCRASSRGRFSKTGPGGGVFGGDRWQTAAFPDEDYNHPLPTFFATHGFTGAKGATIAAGVPITTVNFPPGEFSAAVRIQDITHGKTIAQTGPTDPALGPAGDIPVSGGIGPFSTFEIQVWTDADFGITGPHSVTGIENF